MRTLDRYVVRSFLHSYLLSFFVLMGLRVVTDLFINMDEFAKQALPRAELLGQVVWYYSFQSLTYFQELGGVIIVAGAAFSLARMNHTNELTAMLASGVSLHRVILPLILTGMGLAVLGVVNQEVLIPAFQDQLVWDREDRPGKQKFPVRLITDVRGSVWWSSQLNMADKTMVQPVVWLRDARGKAIATLSAGQAVCLGDGTWRFTPTAEEPAGPDSGTRRITPAAALIPERDAATTSVVRSAIRPEELKAAGTDAEGRLSARDRYAKLVLSAEAVGEGGLLVKPEFWLLGEGLTLVGPANGPGAGDPAVLATIRADSARYRERRGAEQSGAYELTGGELLLASDLTPAELALRHNSRWIEFMSTSSLNALLHSGKVPDYSAAVLTKHTRFTQPLIDVILLLLGLPFILSRERNIKASAGLCLAIVGACYTASFLSRYLGGDSPVLAAWLPVLVFGPVAVALLDSIKT